MILKTRQVTGPPSRDNYNLQ